MSAPKTHSYLQGAHGLEVGEERGQLLQRRGGARVVPEDALRRELLFFWGGW